MTPDAAQEAVQAATEAAESLLRLARTEHGPLARRLSDLLLATADEAGRNPSFATALSTALAAQPNPVKVHKRPHRRAAGPFDPFAVMAESGEAGLRERLQTLDLEQLRDIVAEHGMDHDRLALRWKDAGRVVDRIVEKVHGRNSKGSAFRT